MPGTAQKFLDLLQERKLLPGNVIDGIRRQVEAAPNQFNAHHIAKLLQRKGKLTAFQARELLAEVDSRDVEIEPSLVEPTMPVANDELGLAADDDEKAGERKQSPAPKSTISTKKNSPTTPAALTEPDPLSSGIDDLLDDPLMQADQATDPLLLAPKRKKGWGLLSGGKKSGKRTAAGWDSPLIIVGGGMLVFLMLIGGVLAFILTRESGDALYAAAEQDYLAGSYASASTKYEDFASGHSSHPKASLARVRAGLAKVRIAVAESDWPASLDTAQTVLPTIVGEADFDQARPELAGVLPDIAHGLAEQASGAPDMEAAAVAVEQYREAIKLVDNPAYLPASQRATQNARIERSAEQVAAVVRDIEQQSRLAETIRKIDSLLTDGDPMQAYIERDRLLKLYPRLRDNSDLVAAVKAISAQLVQQVRLSEKSIEATDEPRPTPIIAEAAFGKTSGATIDALKDHVTSSVFDGVLYALAAEDGRLLWRRFVGRETFNFVQVEAAAGADLLVIDSQHHDLLRLQSIDGKIVWRLPVEQPFEMTRIDNRIVLALAGGELWDVDAASGECQRQVRFPQAIVAHPVLSESGKFFQLGEHSNLYVLNADTWKCEGVYFLDHRAGTVRYPPVIAAGVLVIAHDVGLRRALLHVLRETDDAALVSVAQSPLSIDSQIASPLLTEQLRIAVLAENGSVNVLAVDPAKERSPVEIIAKLSANAAEIKPNAILIDDVLFVAAGRLAAYRISTARGSLAPLWVNHNGDTFVSPLHLIDEYVFSVRRQKGKAGVVIAATPRDAANAQDAGRPMWETVIAPGAAQTSLLSVPEGQEIVAYCTTGDSYRIPIEIESSQAFSTPYGVALPPPLSSSAGGKSHWQLEKSTSWRDGKLIPTTLGQVVFEPTHSETPPLHPFQPPLVIGETTNWLRPTVVDDERFLLADSRGELYLIGIDSAGAPHLAALAKTTSPAPPAAGPLLIGESVALVTRHAQHDAIQRIALLEFVITESITLPGRLRWGPHIVGDLFLLSTSPGGLQAYSDEFALLWSHDLNGLLPVGKPVSSGSKIIVATTSGNVIRFAQDEGKSIRETALRQPLAEGPLVVGNRLAMRAVDGSVLFIAGE